MIVVMVGTASLIIALSVFNGLEGVVRSLHSTFNPDLLITPLKGKSFVVEEDFLKQIQDIVGVEVITEVIEDNAILNYRDGQMVVTLKGVSDNFMKRTKMDSTIVYGAFILKERGRSYAVIGRGVQAIMSISLNDDLEPMQLWYPKRGEKLNLSGLDPRKRFNRKVIFPSGVFSLEQSYDQNYVFVPLAFAEALLEYSNRRTALEIHVQAGSSVQQVESKLENLLGDRFSIKNSEEQEESLLKAIKIEKLFVYLVLSFILAISSFNIFFSLMMLVIDKKRDIAIFQAMGATASVIRRIFLLEGGIIALTGAILGLVLGTLICLIQQEYGLISMGTATTIVSAYPVELQTGDFIYTGITIIIITLISSYIPAINATKVGVKENI